VAAAAAALFRSASSFFSYLIRNSSIAPDSALDAPAAASALIPLPGSIPVSLEHVGMHRFLSTMGTMGAVRKAHEIDLQRLLPFLQKSLVGHDWSTCVLQQFLHGQSNPTFHVTSACGHKFVLRKQPPGVLLRGAHAVDREHTIMTAVYGILPVPRTRLMCNDASVIGTPFFMYDFVEGSLYTDVRLPNVTVPHRQAVYASMASTLAKLHSVDAQLVGLQSFGKASGFLSRRMGDVFCCQ
jgi:aminoglycoside phosphotransferase (APT) family kinase protein